MTEQNTVEKIREFVIESDDDVPDVAVAFQIEGGSEENREEFARSLVNSIENEFASFFN